MSSDKGQPQHVRFGCILFIILLLKKVEQFFYFNFIPAAQSK
jgi:hypothetical protein